MSALNRFRLGPHTLAHTDTVDIFGLPGAMQMPMVNMIPARIDHKAVRECESILVSPTLKKMFS